MFALRPSFGAQESKPKVTASVLNQIKEKGVARAIIILDVPYQSLRYLSEKEKLAQDQSVAELKQALIAELSGTTFRIVRDYVPTPMIAVEIDAQAASILARSSRVLSVSDEVYKQYQYKRF